MSSNAAQQENLASARSRFYQNLYTPSTSSSKIKEDLSELSSCYGYDITAIVVLFQMYGLSARLELETKNKEVNAIAFQDGQIQYIELSESDTRLGTLLVNNRLITQQQLEIALKEKGELPIGAHLVQRGLINKEQIGTILLTQSRGRLSKLISEDQFSIRVKESNISIKSSELNIEQFFLLVHDWILSKFSPEWLNSQYLEYYNFTISVKWNDFNQTDLQQYSIFDLFSSDFLEIIDGQKISDAAVIFENNKNFFKAIHFLVLRKWIEISNSNTPDNYEIKIKHIYKLTMNRTGLDLVRKLSLITKQDERNIEAIYEDLKKNYLGPESIANEFKLEIEKKVLNLLINFHNLKDTLGSATEKKAVVPKNIDVKQIKQLLLAQKYNEALALIKKHKDLLATLSKLQLYSAWAHLGMSLFKGTQISSSTLEKEFHTILPEDMTVADYHYVNYLLLKTKKLEPQASAALKRAIELDPNIKNYPVSKSLFGWF